MRALEYLSFFYHCSPKLRCSAISVQFLIWELSPCFLQGAIRVTSMRVLGVTISSNLTMGCHLDEILSSSASSIHALRMLRSHGLGSPQLFEVARSTTLASML